MSVRSRSLVRSRWKRRSHSLRQAWPFKLCRRFCNSSNAFDMQAMLVEPSSVWRGAYILAQAKAIFQSYTSWREGAINGKLHPEHRAQFDKAIADAIKAHEAEVAEEAAYLATPEGKANAAKWAKFVAKRGAARGQMAHGASASKPPSN